MDVMHSCCCCLQCPPDKDLTTPYTHLGTTEIYSNMLKECFNLHLTVGGDGSCGICSACVGRLRDASNFKLQVQRSQAELRARLQGTPLIEDVTPGGKPGEADACDAGDGSLCYVFYEEPTKKLEIDKDDTFEEASYEVPLFKLEPADDVASDEDPTAAALAGLETHDNTAGLRAEEAYTCDTCGKHFTGKSSLIAHVRRHLAQHESVATYSCGTCSEEFSCKNLFAKHTHAHTGQKTYTCDNSFEVSNEFKALDLKRSKRIHTCDKCNKQFRKKYNFDRHTRIHTGEKRYSCEECKKEFTEKYHLVSHKKIHTGERPYNCEECNKQFTNMSNLNTHKRIHTGEKPYKCVECNKQFTTKCVLIRHNRVHSGIKAHARS